jgi:Lrp/AsnC family transcriptional regulator, leucine-responsive regulatory protein
VYGSLIRTAETGVGAEREVDRTFCLLVFEDYPCDRGPWVGSDSQLGDRPPILASGVERLEQPVGRGTSRRRYGFSPLELDRERLVQQAPARERAVEDDPPGGFAFEGRDEGRRVSLSSPAVAERVRRLEQIGVITGYRAELDPRMLGYQLTAIVRIKPAAGQLPRIPELAAEIPEVGECHRITGEDCFYLKVHLRSIDDLSSLLDRFLAFGETTTSLINASPIPRRDPPIDSSAEA